MKLLISEAAREIGVSLQTLRQWHRDNLLVPETTNSGVRLYESTHVEEGKRLRRMRERRGLKFHEVNKS